MNPDIPPRFKNTSLEAVSGRGESVKLIKGNQLDRMVGLEPLKQLVKGASVLDIGSHRGLIAYELAKWGAASIHGFDIYANGIEASREIFADVEIETEFHVANLADGVEPFKAAFKNVLREQYDVVLILAVLHHLMRQMDRTELRHLMEFLTDVCGRYLVMRTPKFEQIDTFILSQGFQLIYFNYVDRNLSPVLIYERT